MTHAMVRTNFFDDDDDDDVAPPPTAPPAAVPAPPPTIATATAPKSFAEVLASAPPFLAAELHEVARSIERDNRMNVEVRQGNEDVPIGTHTGAPPAPAASSSSTGATATLVDIDRAPASRGRARADRRSREERAALEEERAWEAFMEEPPPGGSDSERAGAPPRYKGRDAEVLPAVQRFNAVVLPFIDEELKRADAFSHRRYAYAEYRRRMGLPARSVDISRGDHGRGYGDPENVVVLEPASRNRAWGSRPMTVATQDELFCSPGVADDQPLELTPEEKAAAVAAIALAQTKAAESSSKVSRNMAICQAVSGDVEQHHCRQPTVSELPSGSCACRGEHIAAMREFARRGEPQAALDFVGIGYKVRRELYVEAGRLSRDLLREHSLQLITGSSDWLKRGEHERTLRVVLYPSSPAPIVQCKGVVASGRRCKNTSRGNFPVGQALREGGDFCAHHLWQAPPATPPAQRVASQPTPEIKTLFASRKRAFPFLCFDERK